MDKRNNNMDPWDPDYYETGSTQPPKSYGALIAVLLTGVIVLCGLTSTLGLISANREDPAQESPEKQDAVAFRTEENHRDDPQISSTLAPNDSMSPVPDASLHIAESPLFEITCKDKTWFAYNEQEKVKILKELEG